MSEELKRARQDVARVEREQMVRERAFQRHLGLAGLASHTADSGTEPSNLFNLQPLPGAAAVGIEPAESSAKKDAQDGTGRVTAPNGLNSNESRATVPPAATEPLEQDNAAFKRKADVKSLEVAVRTKGRAGLCAGAH